MSESISRRLKVALAGNPNCGKTTIFNRLTGEKRAVGNYSGVTVDAERGTFLRNDVVFELVDLPGVYSLTTFSKDEVVAREFLLKEKPDVIVDVVDSSNLERNLFLTLQLKELGIPVLVAMNMVDLAKSRGLVFDAENLSAKLALPVVQVVGTTGEGTDALVDAVLKAADSETRGTLLRFSDHVEREITCVSDVVDALASRYDSMPLSWNKPLGVQWLTTGAFNEGLTPASGLSYVVLKNKPDVLLRRRWIALKLLEDDRSVVESWKDPEIERVVSVGVERLSSSDGAPLAAKIAAERYANVRLICKDSVQNRKRSGVDLSDRADRFLTHPVWGLLTFFLAMYLVFWLTFTIGNYPVSWLESLQNTLGDWCNQLWAGNPDSLLRSLIVDGVIAGVGGVLLFFPNIFILFGAISALEESGYMARGAFLTDRFLSRIGLTGKSFIPMLVGFGCSIPAVMSTRIIEDKKSRLATMFVVPLMSCGARFPIYMLLIPAFFPQKFQAQVLLVVYLFGILVAAVVSTILTKTTFRGENAPLLLELPVYHAPTLRTVGAKALERGWQYLRKAGTTILGVSVLLWALSTFPTLPKAQEAVFAEEETAVAVEAEVLGADLDALEEELAELAEENADLADYEPALEDGNNGTEEVALLDDESLKRKQAIELLNRKNLIKAEKGLAQLEYSFAGRLGKAIEPVLKLAGFDWRIGTGLVGALAAKEVFVAQMGIVFKVGEANDNSAPLRALLVENYSPLVGLCVIIFCLVGAPCMGTIVVVAKESSWKWACAQWATLTGLGFLLAVIVYQLGTILHIGV